MLPNPFMFLIQPVLSFRPGEPLILGTDLLFLRSFCLGLFDAIASAAVILCIVKIIPARPDCNLASCSRWGLLFVARLANRRRVQDRDRHHRQAG